MFLPRLLISPSQIPKFPHISRSSRHSYDNFEAQLPLWLKTLHFWRKNVGKLNCFRSNLPDLEIEICRIVASTVKFGGLDMLSRSQDLTETPWDLLWTKDCVLQKWSRFGWLFLIDTMSKCRMFLLNSSSSESTMSSPSSPELPVTWSLSPLAEAALVYLHPCLKGRYIGRFFVRGHHLTKPKKGFPRQQLPSTLQERRRVESWWRQNSGRRFCLQHWNGKMWCNFSTNHVTQEAEA